VLIALLKPHGLKLPNQESIQFFLEVTYHGGNVFIMVNCGLMFILLITYIFYLIKYNRIIASIWTIKSLQDIFTPFIPYYHLLIIFIEVVRNLQKWYIYWSGTINRTLFEHFSIQISYFPTQRPKNLTQYSYVLLLTNKLVCLFLIVFHLYLRLVKEGIQIT
jgi:hypothetical protein